MPDPCNSRGFFTIAQNTKSTDFIKCAYGLALSLKHSQKSISNISLGISPGTIIDERYIWAFDQIIEIPWLTESESYSIENEWKIPYITPYDETIKIHADMLFTNDITLWWNLLSNRPDHVIFANQCLNWRGQRINDDVHRNIFRKKRLPNIYTAFTFMKKHHKTYEIYALAKHIAMNYRDFYAEFIDANIKQPTYSTDIIMALVLKILDLDRLTYNTNPLPTFTDMNFMLQGIKSIHSKDWRNYFTSEFSLTSGIKIGCYRQIYPLHYRIKDFLSDQIIEQYELACNV